jgi:hypothetical protein
MSKYQEDQMVKMFKEKESWGFLQRKDMLGEAVEAIAELPDQHYDI